MEYYCFVERLLDSMAAAAPTPAPAVAMTLPLAQKAAGDRKVVPDEAVQVQERMHDLAVDDSVVDRAIMPRSSAAPNTEVNSSICGTIAGALECRINYDDLSAYNLCHSQRNQDSCHTE